MSDVCLICNQKKATKTNSHIVPSFLITLNSATLYLTLFISA